MPDSLARAPAALNQLANGRHVWVENARAIGIVLVVYGHVMRGAVRAGLVAETARVSLADSIVYSFHMPLFFFLSGLFFYESLCKRGATRLVGNKFDTLLYPYILWSLLQGVIEAELSRWTNGHAALVDALAFAWAPRAQMWFLYALFEICLLGILVYRKTPPRLFGVIGVLAALAFLVRDQDLGTVQIAYLLDYFCFFALGVWFNARQQTLFAWRWWLLLPALAGFCVVQYLFHVTWSLTYRSVGVPALLLALLSIGTVVLASMCMADRQLKWVATIGSSSLAIYLCHIVIASGSRIVLVKALGLHNVPAILLVGCVLGVVLPILLVREAPRLKLQFLFSIPREWSLESWLARRQGQAKATAPIGPTSA